MVSKQRPIPGRNSVTPTFNTSGSLQPKVLLLSLEFAASVFGAIVGHGNVLKASFIIAKKHRINSALPVGAAGNKFRC